MGGAEAIRVPSGAAVTFQEMLSDTEGPEGLTFRFRFVVRPIGEQGMEEQGMEQDMRALCEAFALPRMSRLAESPAQVVISVADRAIAFGDADPGVVQFFEAYRIENGHCIWEAF
ncbi:acetolactate synthase [Haematobacter genomosp. 1]|uniref:Acetolactate synthase n=2 Tax=Haematobacter genomosp. 1 TaxID=366618 RepID=A0A212AC72_9RHOB|nr:acetolactate synthase [Haematobacter genomosp. 1]